MRVRNKTSRVTGSRFPRTNAAYLHRSRDIVARADCLFVYAWADLQLKNEVAVPGVGWNWLCAGRTKNSYNHGHQQIPVNLKSSVIAGGPRFWLLFL